MIILIGGEMDKRMKRRIGVIPVSLLVVAVFFQYVSSLPDESLTVVELETKIEKLATPTGITIRMVESLEKTFRDKFSKSSLLIDKTVIEDPVEFIELVQMIKIEEVWVALETEAEGFVSGAGGEVYWVKRYWATDGVRIIEYEKRCCPFRVSDSIVEVTEDKAIIKTNEVPYKIALLMAAIGGVLFAALFFITII
jgi:hypothetical protein